MPAFIDLTGRRFGRLTVLGRADALVPRPQWRCRCECGWEGAKVGHHLRRGAVKSCGSRACRAAASRGDAAPGVS